MAITRKEARTADQAAVEAAKPVGGEVDSVEAPGGSGRGDQGGVLLHHDCQALRRGDLHQVTISPPHRPVLPELEPALPALYLDQARRRDPRQAEPSNHSTTSTGAINAPSGQRD